MSFTSIQGTAVIPRIGTAVADSYQPKLKHVSASCISAVTQQYPLLYYYSSIGVDPAVFQHRRINRYKRTWLVLRYSKKRRHERVGGRERSPPGQLSRAGQLLLLYFYLLLLLCCVHFFVRVSTPHVYHGVRHCCCVVSSSNSPSINKQGSPQASKQQ